MNLSLIALLIFLAVASVLLAVGLLLLDLRRRDEAREAQLELDLQIKKAILARSPDAQPKGRIDRWFYELIEQSGSPLEGNTATAIVAGMAVIGCAVPLVLLENLPGAAAGAVVGALLPVLWWMVRRERRLRALARGLPETLEMVADSIRAGQTLEQASELVAQQGASPLKEEFGYCAKQFHLGHSPVAVLSRMARRVPLAEFKIFATAVMVHRQTGGNLALLAQRLAGSARDRAEFQGHVRAVTAGSRLSVIGLTVGTMIGLFALGGIRPEYLKAYIEHPVGPTILALSACLMVIGLMWVWRVMKVPF